MENNKSWVPKVFLVLAVLLLLLALALLTRPLWPDLFSKATGLINIPGIANEEGVNVWNEEEGKSVDTTAALVEDLTGSLYFDSLALASEGESEMAIDAANLYRYDLDAEEMVPLVEFGESYDANPISENSVAFVTRLVGEGGSNRSAHILLDTTTGDFVELTNGTEGRAYELAISAENTDFKAFVFRSESVAEQNLYDINNYHILLTNPYSKQTEVLEQAASPTWLAEGKLLMFIKSDGVYLYDLLTEETKLIYDEYTDLSVLNHIAAAEKGKYVVMTIPSLKNIVVLNIIESDIGVIESLEENYEVKNDVVTYKNPVVSPDGRFFAVVASNDTSTGRAHSIEIRHYSGNKVIKEIVPEGVDLESLNLSAWRLEALVPLNEAEESTGE